MHKPYFFRISTLAALIAAWAALVLRMARSRCLAAQPRVTVTPLASVMVQNAPPRLKMLKLAGALANCSRHWVKTA